MKAKFKMTREDNLFVAKRNIIDVIWKSAKLENISVTYPETEEVYYGRSVSGISVDDTITINNLKHAWHFLLDNIDVALDFAYICKLNQLIGSGHLIRNAGFLRTAPVSIGGTTWKPEMPIESEIREELATIMQIESATERAITLMLYCMRRQMFFDGNKRTSMLAANQILIQNGEGILSIPVDDQTMFKTLLVEYYETNDMEKLKTFVYEKCIDGIQFE